MNDVESILLKHYPPDLVGNLLASYQALKDNYYLGKHKPSELEGGFFVEATRRIVEYQLFGKLIPPTTQLPPFNDQEMQRYEQASGDDSYRLHIPRVLKAIYNIRNKRGVGHISGVVPNVIDATLVISCCDWVLAELIRLNSDMTYTECEELIDSIVQKKTPLVFDTGKVMRVLDPQLSTSNQVLILLDHAGTEMDPNVLRSWVEYRNNTRFKEILRALHRDRQIEFDGISCQITPKGRMTVETLLKQKRS